MENNTQSSEFNHSEQIDSQRKGGICQGRDSSSGELEQGGASGSNNPHTQFVVSGILERLDNLERGGYKRSKRDRSQSRSPHRSFRRHRSRSPRSRSRARSPRRFRSRSFRKSRSRGHSSSSRPERRDRCHYSSNYNYRKRERSRSRSHYSSSKPDSDYSDSVYSDRSSSRDSNKRRNRYYSDSDSESDESFPYNGETYIRFNKRKHSHVEGKAKRILWRKEILPVKWHPNSHKRAFCVLKTSSDTFPYMDKSVSHDTLLSNLKVTPSSGDNPGFKRKAFNAPFDQSSGLGMAIGSIMSLDKEIIHKLLVDDEAAAQKELPEESFTTPSIAVFSTGWPKDLNYMEWSKGEVLDLSKVTQPLDISTTTKISKDLLNDERDTRAHLVNNLTGLRSLELLSDNLKEESKKSSTLAIAKIFLPNIRYFVVKWMAAKMRLRKEILHNQDTNPVRILLKSNMWDPSIFPKEAFDEARNSKNSGLRTLLNLDTSGGLTKKSFDSTRYPQGNSNYKGKSYDKRKQRGSYSNRRGNRGYKNERFSSIERKPKDSFRNQERNRDNPYESFPQNQNTKRQGKNSQRGKNGKYRGQKK